MLFSVFSMIAPFLWYQGVCARMTFVEKAVCVCFFSGQCEPGYVPEVSLEQLLEARFDLLQ